MDATSGRSVSSLKRQSVSSREARAKECAALLADRFTKCREKN